MQKKAKIQIWQGVLKYLETAQDLADKFLMNDVSQNELKKQNQAHFQEFIISYRTKKSDSIKLGKYVLMP